MAFASEELTTTGVRSADGLAIRFAQGGAPDAAETLLMLSPWPESLFAWHTLWPRLTAVAHVIAIDLPGFGQSERRAQLLSPSAMGGFLLRLIDEWQIDQPHVVGPDVGTGATLFAAASDPGRLRSAVVGSGGSAWPLRVTGTLKTLIEAPNLDDLRAVDGRTVVANALEGHVLSAGVREDYLTSYAGDRFVESANYVRSYPTDLRVLADRLGEITTPVQIIAGRQDPFVPPENAEFLSQRLPRSELALLDTGHFAWEDGADEWGSILLSWIGGRYRS